MLIVQVQVLVLDLSIPTSFQFSLRTFFGANLVPVSPFAQLLFVSYELHFTAATKEKKVIDVTASIGQYLTSSSGKCVYVTCSASKK